MQNLVWTAFVVILMIVIIQTVVCKDIIEKYEININDTLENCKLQCTTTGGCKGIIWKGVPPTAAEAASDKSLQKKDILNAGKRDCVLSDSLQSLTKEDTKKNYKYYVKKSSCETEEYCKRMKKFEDNKSYYDSDSGEFVTERHPTSPYSIKEKPKDSPSEEELSKDDAIKKFEELKKLYEQIPV